MRIQKRNLQPVVPIQVILHPYRLCFQAPISWTINKIKCFIISQVPILKFDQFKITLLGSTLKGKYSLKNLLSNSHSFQTLIFQITKSKHSDIFQNFYSETMSKFFQRIQKQQDLITDNAPQQTLPFLHKDYKKIFLMSQRRHQTKNRKKQKKRKYHQEGEREFGFFNLMQVIGLYLISNLVFSFGNVYKIFIILAIAFTWYIVEIHVKNQQKKIIQRKKNINFKRKTQKDKNNDTDRNFYQKQPQPKTLNLIGAILLQVLFTILQLCYCYFLSLFPNWTVETHLEANRRIINKAINTIQLLDITRKGKIQIDKINH